MPPSTSTLSLPSASAITLSEFQQYLTQYPTVLSVFADTKKSRPNTTVTPLSDLDKYRYETLPTTVSARLSSSDGAYLTNAEVVKLVEWKLCVPFSTSLARS